MTRERVEPGIWRRGEVFEITWRDAQGKQRRKTGQGGCQAEVVDQERPVGTRMLQRSSRISRPSALARSTTRFRRRWDSRNFPWRQLALDRRSPSSISSVRPSSADIPAESDPAPGPEAEALTSTASLVDIWDRRSISASSCVWSSTSRSAKTAPISSLIALADDRASGPFRGLKNQRSRPSCGSQGPLPPHPAIA
jgi:hypothetical protein